MTRTIPAILAGLGLLLTAGAATLAHADQSLRVDGGVIAGGGGLSDGGDFSLQGTVGQFEADPLQPASGGDFSVTGGFWAGLSVATAETGDVLFEDGFEPR